MEDEDQKLQWWLWNAIMALKDDGTAQTRSRAGFWDRLIVTVALGAWLVWAKLVVQLWLKPTKTRSHFSRQGVGGQPPTLGLGNMKEIAELMVTASAEPMAPPSHDIDGPSLLSPMEQTLL